MLHNLEHIPFHTTETEKIKICLENSKNGLNIPKLLISQFFLM